VWKPAARVGTKRNGVIRGVDGRSGTRIPRAGSAGGAANPKGEGRDGHRVVVHRVDGTDEAEVAARAGARKPMRGATPP
jgi:hypothetical protein